MTGKRLHSIRGCTRLYLALLLGLLPFALPVFPQSQANKTAEYLVTRGDIGQSGGRLVLSLRAVPKTLNPLVATDAPSREVIGVMQADLIHINRATQLT